MAGERQLSIRQGTKRVGLPGAATLAAIVAIQDVNRLESLGEGIVEPEVRNWDDLLRGT